MSIYKNLLSNARSLLDSNISPAERISNAINSFDSFATSFEPEGIRQGLEERIESAGISTTNDALSSRLPTLSDFNDFTQAITVVDPKLGQQVKKIQNIVGAISSISERVNQTSISGLGGLGGSAGDFEGVNFGGPSDILSSDGTINLSQLSLSSGGGLNTSLGGLTGGSAAPAVQGSSSSKVPNPLRSYASYNYLLAISCLSKAELNTPASTYRSNGLQNVVVRSAGNTEGRVTTAAEDSYGTHAEYYIDDLNVETVLTHNNITGVASGTHITFKIVEPYSMGQFIEALAVSAVQADNYQNYIDAPFCLEIKFAGWDDNGNLLPDPSVPPKYIPFRLINVTFNVIILLNYDYNQTKKG